MNWKHTMSALVVTVLLAAPAALQAQDHGGVTLNGSYDLEFAAPWGMAVWTFDLESDGTKVTGQSVQGMGTLMLEGTITGHDIAFVVDLKDGPHALTIEFTGTATPDGITGTFTHDGVTDSWTLAPARRR